MLKYLSFLTRVAAFVVFVIHGLNVLVDQPSWSPARWTWPVENTQMSLRQLSSRCFQLEQPAAWPTWSRSLWTRLKSDFRWGSPGEQTILSTQTQPPGGASSLTHSCYCATTEKSIGHLERKHPKKNQHFTPYRINRQQRNPVAFTAQLVASFLCRVRPSI